jgi:hypothetical protein
MNKKKISDHVWDEADFVQARIENALDLLDEAYQRSRKMLLEASVDLENLKNGSKPRPR